jgi:hypothetical protein
MSPCRRCAARSLFDNDERCVNLLQVDQMPFTCDSWSDILGWSLVGGSDENGDGSWGMVLPQRVARVCELRTYPDRVSGASGIPCGCSSPAGWRRVPGCRSRWWCSARFPVPSAKEEVGPLRRQYPRNHTFVRHRHRPRSSRPPRR